MLANAAGVTTEGAIFRPLVPDAGDSWRPRMPIRVVGSGYVLIAGTGARRPIVP
jgi:hypothetical protein